jgi:hypothetical protein
MAFSLESPSPVAALTARADLLAAKTALISHVSRLPRGMAHAYLNENG